MSVCGLLAFSATAYAGERLVAEDRVPAERRTEDPATLAKRRTDEADSVLHLSKKQYKKVYKLYLKEEKRRAESRPAMRPPEGGGPSRDGGMQGPPPRGMAGGPGHGGGEPPRMAPPKTKSDREAEAEMEKKMRKILSEEQFALWERMRFETMKRRLPGGDGTPEPRPEN